MKYQSLFSTDSLVKMNNKKQRTEKQLREHYEIEKRLASRLRNATRKERRFLYTSLYEELYRLVPHHSQLTRKTCLKRQEETVRNQMKLLIRFLGEEKSFLEIGPGDCALAFEVAKYVRQVYAVDVSETITKNSNVPKKFQLLLSDGVSIPVRKNSIDVAYSNQLMEHLHEDDAYNQLKNIFDTLAPGGVYLCLTPNRLNGPHDISKYFDMMATGLHLKEYTVTELRRLFKKVGFSKVMKYNLVRGEYRRLPIFPAILCESLLKILPNVLRRNVANTKLISGLIIIRLLGIKSNKRKNSG